MQLDGTAPLIREPHPNLLKYYAITSFAAGPFFFIPLIVLYFRFHTLRCVFDQEGITMRWGILFRREIILTYARIQDIHLVSNFVERWLGLGRIQIQTASGSASAEMTIEGLQDFDAIRDFLYSRMRGARHAHESIPAVAASPDALADAAASLHAAAVELRAIRETVGRGKEARS